MFLEKPPQLAEAVRYSLQVDPPQLEVPSTPKTELLGEEALCCRHLQTWNGLKNIKKCQTWLKGPAMFDHQRNFPEIPACFLGTFLLSWLLWKSILHAFGKLSVITSRSAHINLVTALNGSKQFLPFLTLLTSNHTKSHFSGRQGHQTCLPHHPAL